MQYIYDYLYLSLAFSAIIAYRFFSQQQFPSLRTRLFGAIIITTIVDLLLDICSSLVIENALSLPPALTCLVSYCFYAVQSVFPLLLLLYILSLTHRRKWLSLPHILLLIMPAALTFLLLLSNLFMPQLFYVDSTLGFVHGPLFFLLYVNCFVYIFLSFLSSFYYRKQMIAIEFQTVITFLVILVAMIAAQYMLPCYLVSGASFALALTLMYIVMQKPEDMIDAVSGAFNQTALNVFTQNTIDERKQLSFVVLELLYMRRINRLFGTEFGNRVLQAVVQEMHRHACGGWLFRPMGNIFMLAGTKRSDMERAYNEIRQCFAQEIVIAGIPMSLSVTILSLPDTGTLRTAGDLTECLESALNTSTRGECRVVPVDLLSADRRHEEVEDVLLDAIRDHKITAALQPIYDLRRGRFLTAEALARLHHETLGNVSPAEFIPIAEKNGAILSIDLQIIRNVCRFLSQYGSTVTAVQVNLSPVEFVSESICSRIIDIVQDFGVDPGQLWFEITESSLDADAKLLQCMNRLRAEGFRFVLDDFGVGYSNVARIMQLPFSMVKLDRSMLLASMEDSRRALIMKSTIQMLRDLKLETLVEGVETKEQADAMYALGVDYIQGFFYARPMPMQEAARFLEHHGARH